MFGGSISCLPKRLLIALKKNQIADKIILASIYSDHISILHARTLQFFGHAASSSKQWAFFIEMPIPHFKMD